MTAELINHELLQALESALRNEEACSACWSDPKTSNYGHYHYALKKGQSPTPGRCPCKCHADDNWPAAARAAITKARRELVSA